MVALGGSDAGNMTPAVLRALQAADLRDTHITVVVGPLNRQLEALRSETAAIGSHVRLIANADMPKLMTSVDMAISAGGVSSRELAFMGVPQVVMQLAANQAGNVRALAAHGAAIASSFRGEQDAIDLTQAIRAVADDVALRQRMRDAGRALIDGLGAKRVVESLLVFH